ncbi:quinohemoprotein amine dehydrogenase subunit alpha [Malaciobacter molluscorum LMG 25693]|uniref:Quinohemoprotein amine dehydrogenase subunit alpha n=1 Tax=Malaciobacter molluscorum LMG 25693 TaxID=870501 RepID=A0A2G1DL39_9BACT|nr:quinohemoprotein amine dehydrogenase subunit alpha [Malaciobacter molluscorum]AXX92768.1 quinohemoprotein amine dehydrogenase, alpha subunit [Malaciobacter molluscorum LMG 25693]PHO19180.1 quinohemoprotein amine dehydrogenase subunit alpha [Malaciobacter molluscorum LMG 25693]
MNYVNLSKIAFGLLLSSVSLFAVDANNGAKVLETKCIACHTGSLKDGLSRISDQRKTPEGWYMTINRMQRIHGLLLTQQEEKDVVKYLSDNQGLTPKEIKPFKYVLDKTPNYQEKKTDELFTQMCIRCHSQARIGLQRRTAKEWDGLVNFHVAQFISFEVQANARDRDWLGIAQKKIVPYLEKLYGKQEKTWTNYLKSVKNYELPLSWTFEGHSAKDGDFDATLKLTKAKDDSYIAIYEQSYLNGKSFKASGKAILYSKSELRISLKDANGIRYSQILHINPINSEVEGRIYQTEHSELGASLKGIASDNKKSVITGIFPNAIKSNDKTKLVIVGSSLSSDITLPKSLKLLKTISKSKNKIELEVLAKDINSVKQFDLKVGNTSIKDAIVIYNKVDYLKIIPGYAISRYGSSTEKIKKEFTQFEAIGFSNGADGKKGTSDDIKLKPVNVIWNMKPFDEQAKEDRDIMYAGSINRYTGLFTPSEGGYNPTRKLMANNVGNLMITATFLQNNKYLEAKSHLIVTVPKFVNPPIN